MMATPQLKYLVRALPWVLAAVYLFAIALLGWQFHLQRDHKVSQLTELTVNAEQQTINLGLLRTSTPNDPPTVFEHTFKYSDDKDWALLLPRYASDADIDLNGIPVYQHAISYPARHAYVPSIVPLPNKLLRSDNNQLRISLIPHSRQIVLSQLYLGPLEQIEPLFQQFYFWRVPLMQATWVITIIVAVFMGTIWLVRRQLREYGWIALAFISVAIFLESFIRTTEPSNLYLYSWQFLAGRSAFMVTFLIFTHRVLHLHRPRLEYLTASLCIAIFSTGLGLVLTDHFPTFVILDLLITSPLSLLLLMYMSWCFWKTIRSENQTYLHWFLVSSLLALVLGFHDILVSFDVQHPLVRDFFLSQYAILFTVAGYGGVMVHRIAAALLNSEELNIELTRRIDKKTVELETAARDRLAQDKRLLLYAERQRIMSDMHDGVGGQLVSLLAANRDGQLAPAEINQTLDWMLADLRLVLDALSPSGEELVTALARLKERYSSLLKHADIKLQWRIDPAIEAIPMPPSDTVNVLRLVQEAMQNSIKHAHADTIEIHLTQHGQAYWLTIIDDGVGLNHSEQFTSGYGTRTMQRRAEALNGDLETSAGADGGTQVKLRFPVPAT